MKQAALTLLVVAALLTSCARADMERMLGTPQPVTETATPSPTNTAASVTASAPRITATPSIVPRWSANLKVEPPLAISVGGVPYNASSRLTASWKPVPGFVDHYRLVAREFVGRTEVAVETDGQQTDAVLTGLKSATSYTVQLLACENPACSRFVENDAAVIGTTAFEVWQLTGERSGFANAASLLPDGGGLPAGGYVFGNSAPEAIADTIRLYDSVVANVGVSAGIRALDASDNDGTSFLPSQVLLPAQCGADATNCLVEGMDALGASQVVPIHENGVRFYFTALDATANGFGIFAIESEDGETGTDFNAGEQATCVAAVAGECVAEPVLLADDIGVDAITGFRIGWPSQHEEAWFELRGAFMLVAIEADCLDGGNGIGYAVWDGEAWVLQRDAEVDCAFAWPPLGEFNPVHAGGRRWQLYHATTIEQPADVLTRRIRVSYADAGQTGIATTVDIADWEPFERGRDLRFVWPDGREMGPLYFGQITNMIVLRPSATDAATLMYAAIREPVASLARATPAPTVEPGTSTPAPTATTARPDDAPGPYRLGRFVLLNP